MYNKTVHTHTPTYTLSHTILLTDFPSLFMFALCYRCIQLNEQPEEEKFCIYTPTATDREEKFKILSCKEV